MHHVEELTEEIWFFPSISKKQAHDQLSTQAALAFLVRFSSHRHSLVISKKEPDIIAEAYITKNGDKFRCVVYNLCNG